ncbi:hypothetical protein GOODEAATRI_029034 [Goodea atripinnis]|uniref:Uncharacterized protein n=1 Tax=Goodea atripinnis TaxID=208336 RepID=A0ABV0NSE7_9TELE
MALEAEGNKLRLQDVLARPGNEMCADCGNPVHLSPSLFPLFIPYLFFPHCYGVATKAKLRAERPVLGAEPSQDACSLALLQLLRGLALAERIAEASGTLAKLDSFVRAVVL